MEKIKAVLLDADGLLLKKQKYFSQIYSEKYGVPDEDIIPFFKNEFRQCQKGKMDIKEILPPYLEKWRWQGDVDAFLDFWFSSCTETDPKILRIVDDLRERGVQCYLTADQEKYRGEYIRKNLGLGNRLDGLFYSCDFGYSKSEKEYFENILKSLELEPEEVIFFDDEAENVNVAESVGINAKLITTAVDFKETLDALKFA